MNKDRLPDLHETLLAALDFFQKNPPRPLKVDKKNLPFVVGSGNALNAGKIILAQHPAVFASESDFNAKLQAYKPLIKNKSIRQALVISASGEKDAAWEITAAKKAGLKTTLLTCNAQSSGAKLADKVTAYRKLPEPQTYNISTYLGMIISASGEKAANIQSFIKKLKLPANFGRYRAYAFILPDAFAEVVPMLDIKRHELFGPNLSIRNFTFGDARHAKFVMPAKDELVISCGQNKYFGLKESRLEIKLPANAGPGLIMALSYYLIGRIQAAKLPYYKKNIAKYCQEGPKAYGKDAPFDLIVPGN